MTTSPNKARNVATRLSNVWHVRRSHFRHEGCVAGAAVISLLHQPVHSTRYKQGAKKEKLIKRSHLATRHKKALKCRTVMTMITFHGSHKKTRKHFMPDEAETGRFPASRRRYYNHEARSNAQDHTHTDTPTLSRSLTRAGCCGENEAARLLFHGRAHVCGLQ